MNKREEIKDELKWLANEIIGIISGLKPTSQEQEKIEEAIDSVAMFLDNK